MFIDQVVIDVKAGRGGDGVIHFRREKYVPLGGPDGGDGGKGGDVILCVRDTLNTLSHFRHRRIFRAQDGSRGGGNNKSGKSGDDLIIGVPPGTVVYDATTGTLIGDMVEKNQTLIVCKGGRGGKGNARFANSRNRAPRIAEKGEPPEERELKLELKLIADIGIVGVPNAGKSTFLSVVTNAKPKIASYPFTTLEPNLGVAELDVDNSLVLADIPGLIEGAHQGIGLGHDFLRHIQRTKVLIHLLDGLSDDPVADFAQINSELALFDPKLGEKPQVVALNKMDLGDVQEKAGAIKSALKARGYNVSLISAVTGEGVRDLLFRAKKTLEQLPVEKPVEDSLPLYQAEDDPKAFTVTETEKGYRVSGDAIERAASMTYWEEPQSIRRFQRILETLGIDETLRKAGISNGDTVFIGQYELEWKD